MCPVFFERRHEPLAYPVHKCGGKVQRFDGRRVTSQQGCLRRTPRVNLKVKQPETVRQGSAELLGARPAIVAQNIGKLSIISLSQCLNETFKADTPEIARIPVSADALVWGIHVNYVFRASFTQHVLVVCRA